MLVTDWIHPFFYEYFGCLGWLECIMHTAHRCDENILRTFFRYSVTKFRRRNIEVVKLDPC